MKFKTVSYLVYIALFFIIPHQAYAETFNINPGESIQDVIDSAADGDILELSAGTYFGDLDYSGKNITIRGIGRDTVINGTGVGPVVSFQSGEGLSAILDSLTVTGGNDSGGILIKDSRANIRRCFVIFNRSEANGSGIYVTGNDPDGNSAALFNNVIAFNRLRRRAGGDPHGVFIRDAKPNLTNNTIVRSDSNGIFITGNSSPTIKNNILAFNGSRRRNVGRGICVINIPETESPIITYNLFFRNRRGSVFFIPSGEDAINYTNDQIVPFETTLSDYFTGESASFTDNIFGNPRFRRLSRARNLRLRSNSAAIDAGDPQDLDEDNSIADLGASGGFFPIFNE
ncbi:MAG: right-handed parallel beta-helix repeat-containing protein [Candidatus Caenarcaniphilales bacterium]|nr:right-handed parallel beta-helix repeat-containing protein [Candidatus Caenarcaniphilales bacterium]